MLLSITVEIRITVSCRGSCSTQKLYWKTKWTYVTRESCQLASFKALVKLSKRHLNLLCNDVQMTIAAKVVAKETIRNFRSNG